MPVKVVSVERLPAGRDVQVCDFTVPAGAYFAAGVLVSNSKRFGMLNVNAVLSHGASHVVGETGNVRGTRNDDYWLQVMLGHTPREPDEPTVYKKFFDNLRASGVNVVRDGSQLHIMGMTRHDAEKLTGNRAIAKPETVRVNGLGPIAGGLFDPKLTGGHGGKIWSHIPIDAPLPNPVMEEPLRRLLGLTAKQYEGVIAGAHELDGYGAGPAALQGAFADYDVKRQLNLARAGLGASTAQARDDARRKLGFLKKFDAYGLRPADFTFDRVPVLPPAFRPISALPSGSPIVADPNYLYQDLIRANQNLKSVQAQAGSAAAGPERLALYHAFKAVTGLGDPIGKKSRDKQVTGILAHVFSGSPKFSMMQRQLLSTTVDNVGRAVVVPDPDLDMDQVGLPEDIAFDAYSKHMVRRLVRSGLKPTEALKHVRERTPQARKALLAEMDERPVYIDRAPVLHKFGVMGFRPQLTAGKVLRFPPLSAKGFNLDHDGNCVGFHSVVTLTLTNEFRKSTAKATATFHRALSEAVMRLTGQTLVSAYRQGAELRLPIGEFPRVGRPQITTKGQEIYAVPSGVCIQSYDITQGRIVAAPITGFTVEAAHACVDVVTARGRRVTVSDNESLCAFDPDQAVLRKTTPADALEKQWLMPVAIPAPIVGKAYNRDLGWWYAAVAADGWTTRGILGYAKNEKPKRDEFVRIARDVVGAKFNLHEYSEGPRAGKFGQSTKIHLTAFSSPDPLLSVLTPAGMARDRVGRGALFKTLPPQMLSQGNRETLLGLFSGLLDGDASIGWNKTLKKPRLYFRFNTSSPALVETIGVLCRKLGLRYSVTTTPARNRSHESYVISPSVTDLRKIVHELTPVGEHERKILAEFAAIQPSVRTDNIDSVPVPMALATALATRLGRQSPNLYGIFRKALTTLTVNRASAVTALASDFLVGFEHPQLALFESIVACTDVHWDRVAAVTDAGTQPVFDFEIPSTKIYAIDNGLIVWDTMSVHVPETAKSVREVHDMMPSRNLFSAADFRSPMHVPGQQFQAGLYHGSTARTERKTQTFATVDDALRALRAGDIEAGDPVEILDRDAH